MKKLKIFFGKDTKALNLVIIFVGIGLFIFLAVLVISSLSKKPEGTITEDQIKIQRGDKIVIVNKDGLIEYRSEKGVFYETWDSTQILNFFAFMETQARAYLANPQPDICNTGYTVTLYLDGEEVTVCLTDEVLNEVFEVFPDEGGDGDIADLFDDYFGDDEENGVTGTPTPTPLPGEVTAEEGEDVPGGDGGSLPVVTCELNEEDVTSRTVISNILCAPDEPSPTPTPLP